MAIRRSCLLGLSFIVLLLTQIGCEKEKAREPVKKPVLQSWQGPASVCSPKMPYEGNCNTTGANINTCTAGKPCTLSVAMSNGAATVTLNGAMAPVDPICIPQGMSVQWITSTANSDFSLDFGNAPPFSDTNATTFAGDNFTPHGGGNGVPVAHNVVNLDQCYKYNVKVCTNVAGTLQNPTITCGETDPHIIIGSGQTMMGH
jgi:hypothetical protein